MRSTSTRSCVLSVPSAARILSMSSIGNSFQRPRWRSLSISLWRAIAVIPRTDGPVEIPGMSLQMDGQESLLNDIFRLAAIQANAGAIAARCCPQDGRKRSEKLTISTSIAIDRRAHQHGPSLLGLTTLHAIPHASLLAARTLLHE